MNILVINTGSTSTKLAIYCEEEEVCVKTIHHPSEEIQVFPNIFAQIDYRKQRVAEFLESQGWCISDFDCAACRGADVKGFVQRSGVAYPVTDAFYNGLKTHAASTHAAVLSALIGHDLLSPYGKTAYIYDGPGVDDFEPVATFSGLEQIVRQSRGHPLNARAMARKVAQELGKEYAELNMIVAHMGGGISVSAHKQAKIIDMCAPDEGGFSPERPGSLPALQMNNLIAEIGWEAMNRNLRGRGGMVSYLGTNDLIQVETRIASGDNKAKAVFEAMAYQTAKTIAGMSAVFGEKTDVIVLTGGLAHSKAFTALIEERVNHIAPVIIKGGECEMEALAAGVHRALEGLDPIGAYDERPR